MKSSLGIGQIQRTRCGSYSSPRLGPALRHEPSLLPNRNSRTHVPWHVRCPTTKNHPPQLARLCHGPSASAKQHAARLALRRTPDSWSKQLRRCQRKLASKRIPSNVEAILSCLDSKYSAAMPAVASSAEHSALGQSTSLVQRCLRSTCSGQQAKSLALGQKAYRKRTCAERPAASGATGAAATHKKYGDGTMNSVEIGETVKARAACGPACDSSSARNVTSCVGRMQVKHAVRAA